MRRALVTGAGGFIGSHLVERLVQAGDDVTAFVRYDSRGDRGWLEGSDVRQRIRIVAGDVRDADAVAGAVRGQDVVFHLAALIGIPYSYESPLAYIRTNVEGTYNVLQAARQAGGVKVVHTSTSEVYGSAQTVPITEQHPLVAQSPYAASKIGADQTALAFHRSFGLPVAVVRPFNTYGPRQSARAVIPTIVTQVLSGSSTVRLGAVEPTRDFTFVEDTVEGFVAAASHDAAIGRVVQLGGGHEIAIGKLAETIASIVAEPVRIEIDPARRRPGASEVARLRADATLADRLLGWRPAYAGAAGLRRGLERTIDWFARSENLRRYDPGCYAV